MKFQRRSSGIVRDPIRERDILHAFFCWLWCALIFAIAVWGLMAFSRIRASGLVSPEQARHVPALVFAFGSGIALLAATMFRQRFPNVLGPVQLATSWLVFPALRLIHEAYPLSVDQALYNLDRLVWGGKSLPHWVMAIEHPWVSEVLSFCYFAFYFIIIGSAVYFAIRRGRVGSTFFYGLMLMYLFGFLGYIALPAAGPYAAFEFDFSYPPAGGPMTHFLVGVVHEGVTGMDVFPSLHCGLVLYIMGFFALTHHRKTALALLPLFIGITLATVYLRYHYGIDLIAGAVLALAVLAFIRSDLCLTAPQSDKATPPQPQE